MRFRRKGTTVPEESQQQGPGQQEHEQTEGAAPSAEGGEPARDEAAGPATDASGATGADAAGTAPAGPRDAEEVTDDGVDRIDLGSLLLEAAPGTEIRLQVHEETQQVQSVLLAGEDGALELKPFAAPRGEDLWEEVRPQIAADVSQRGGTATEQAGPFGPELACQLPVQRQDGQAAVQASRILGVNGPRWLLRATLLGAPATDRENASGWDALLAAVVVRRGTEPMASGDPLPLVMPPDARPEEEPDAAARQEQQE